MKKSMKKPLLIALLLCLAGLIIWFVSLAAVEFDITKISTVDHETNTYEIDGEFDKILIETDTADIRFVWTEEDCKMVCHEEAKVKHTATVRDDTLVIRAIDTREWYDHVGMSFEDVELTLYLPKTQFLKVDIESDTGDVEVPEDFRFDWATVKTDTGKINWKVPVTEKFTAKSDTGDVWAEADAFGLLNIDTSTGDVTVNAETFEELSVGTTTGDITVTSVKDDESSILVSTDTGEILFEDILCKICSTESDTGKIRLKNVIAHVTGYFVSDTGDVTLENADVLKNFYIKTDTGDVTGTLLSEKTFLTETDTGRINVPKTTGDVECHITTNTGDINIEVIGQK